MTRTEASHRVSPRPVAAAGSAVGLIFGGIARLRANRALHPDGVALRGTFRDFGSVASTALLGGIGERGALVRISRGGGLPEMLPDILGCAIRVPDAYGPGAHQDLALASSGKRPVGRHALVPARDFVGAFYSSILPYRLGSEKRLLGAELASATGSRYDRIDELHAAVAFGDPVTVTLLTASPLGSWEPVATVRTEEVASASEARGLRFNPWNTGGGIEPLGFLNTLRDPAYRASQAASPGS